MQPSKRLLYWQHVPKTKAKISLYFSPIRATDICLPLCSQTIRTFRISHNNFKVCRIGYSAHYLLFMGSIFKVFLFFDFPIVFDFDGGVNFTTEEVAVADGVYLGDVRF